jgi:valyl-tRNA synthetase
METKIRESWTRTGLYNFNVNSEKKIFVIDTPPPYPSGSWHIGAAAQYSEIDMIARTARMLGNEVLFPIGIDRNGLPVELYTEKKYKISMRETPREKFLELCKTALDDLEHEIVQIMERMGLSGNFEEKYRTDSESFRILTQATFIKLWREGQIYIGKRPSNYCVDCGTTIADAEIEYRELPTKLVYFKFDVSGNSNTTMTIASTRPELVCTCQAVIVNPDDTRYSDYIGKEAVLPYYERKVPILAHPSAKPEFGSGAVMVCSYGDYSDALLFRELKLQEIIAIEPDGKMNSVAGELLAGKRVKVARATMIQILENQNRVTRIEEILHRTPLCERSKTPIEIIPLEEYYLKVIEVKNKLREEAHKIHFHPETQRQLLLNWIDVALDWPISRRRFYGTEVPVWYCCKCKTPYVPEAGIYYQPWRGPPPGSPACSKCGSHEFIGDERTFDTWMDSSVSPLFISKYLTDENYFGKTYPNSIRPQGKDIVRTWLHYTLLRCLEITGEDPWPDVWIGGMGLDESGQKMSKSKGNVIDPTMVLNQYGADTFRLWAASEVSTGSDFNISLQKIAGTGKFLTKLWNIARFISLVPKPDVDVGFEQLTTTDKWMISELSKLIQDSLNGYLDYNFFIPSNSVRDFAWNTFAAHYIEMAKGRAYGQGFSESEKLSAQYTLHLALRTILLLLAPIVPFVTEQIWLSLYSETSIHKERFPEALRLERNYLNLEKELLEFNSLVWNEKKSKGLSLKDPILIEIPANLQGVARDLRVMHNLKS